MARLIVLDEALPAALTDELRARGRAAATLAELGVPPGALDAEVLEAVASRDAVLVTAHALAAGAPVAAPVALIASLDPAARRDAVHRHAPAIAAQRAGTRRYA